MYVDMLSKARMYSRPSADDSADSLAEKSITNVPPRTLYRPEISRDEVRPFIVPSFENVSV